MFTGLIETLGTIVSVERKSAACVIGVRPELPDFTAAPGASVAIDGVCLTVEIVKGPVLYFTAVNETIERTTLAGTRLGSQANLERPLAATGRLDGHFVLGHVDGVGAIVKDRAESGGLRRTIRAPGHCRPFLAEKGSVAIDGISLTIAEVRGDEITVALIPRTLKTTTMGKKRERDAVNIEYDALARYIHAMLFGDKERGGNAERGKTILERMEGAGF